jgi:glycosyltransferase involved in cell wall biosynthesis
MVKSNQFKIGVIMQSPDMGGAEMYMLSLIDQFLKNECKIFLASNKEKFLSKANTLPIVTYEIPIILDIIGNYKGLIKSIFYLPYMLYFYANLLWKFKQEKVDVILMSGFSEKLLVSFLSIFFHIQVVWIEYGPLKTIFRRNLYIPWMLYFLLKGVPKTIIIPAQNTMQSLHNDGGVPNAKMKIIPCGIAVPKENKKFNYNLAPNLKNKFVIGNISRATREKGQQCMIKAMSEILKMVPNAHLLLVGQGPDFIYFQNLAKEIGIADNIEFAGFVKDVDDYYSVMDIFVFPTIWELEGFGLVVPEAMSHKIPVIGSNTGPVPEVIDDKLTGLLVPPGDEKALAKAIISLANDAEMRQQLGINAYKKVLKNYNIQKISKNILQILQQ